MVTSSRDKHDMIPLLLKGS